jgi:hypothetical protein
MSLDTAKLENVRERGGKIVARCPACAELGGDNSAEHLVILDGGKWGCIAHPGEHGKEHRRRIAELVGDNATATPRPAPVCRPAAKKPPRPLPTLRRPPDAELAKIAASRGWPSRDGLEVLVDRGQLFVAEVWDDGRTWPAWLVCDSTRANVQARKLDGGLWTGIGGKKPKSLPGTSTLRMIGPADIGTRPEVWAMEGQPDFAAAPIVARRAGLDLDRIAFCCITGANENAAPLHADDLAPFAGKRVVIAVHHDKEHGLGGRAAARWADQFYRAGAAEVVGFDFAGSTGKDLADYLSDSKPTTASPLPSPVPAPSKPAVAKESPPPPPLTAPKATPPAPAMRPPLVPLESPWAEGARYRLAQAAEWPSRRTLYIADPTGDTVRRHGALILVRT